MRVKLFLIVLLVCSSAAMAQLAPATPAAPACSYMTYPVNRPTNKAPLPPASWHTAQSAVVWVDVTVDVRGYVKNPAISISGGEAADAAVLKAVREWTFQPAMCGLQPVETRIHLKLNLGVGKPGTAPHETPGL